MAAGTKVRAVTAAIVLSCGFSGISRAEWALQGADARAFTCVSTSTGEEKEALFAGTEEGKVGISRDGGAHWEFRRCPGSGLAVRALLAHGKPPCLYALTERGVFRSADSGRSWKQVYRSREGERCLCLGTSPEGICCGTTEGLMVSRDGKSWSKRERMPVFSLAFSRDTLYAVSGNSLYAKDMRDGKWEKLLLSLAGGHGEEEVSDESEAFHPGPALAAEPGGIIFASDGRGILFSEDRGRSWKDINVAGAAGARVNALSCSSADLFAATSAGILRVPIKEAVAADREYNKGFLKEAGPGIAEVQRAAVAFADAGAEKIGQWRGQARRKAWLPHLSVGLDRETGDLWHWESGSSTKENDDCLRKGKDSVNWSVSLIWELGDLLWNDAQTSIDSRAHLTAELRNEVVEEATRLYFERKRLMLELDRLPPEDRKKRAEKALKLEETTALLDGITGGVYAAGRLPDGAKISCK